MIILAFLSLSYPWRRAEGVTEWSTKSAIVIELALSQRVMIIEPCAGDKEVYAIAAIDRCCDANKRAALPATGFAPLSVR